jgi:hypothetical protein
LDIITRALPRRNKAKLYIITLLNDRLCATLR